MMEYTNDEQQRLDEIMAAIDAALLEPDAPGDPPPGTRRVGTPGGHWRTAQDRVALLVRPGEIVTQYGTTWFRELPQFYGQISEVEISMMLGRRDVEFAAWKVLRRGPKKVSTVRYFRSSDLWLNGYIPALTPTEHNRFHVSIYYGGLARPSDVEQAAATWADPSRVTLESLAISANEAL